MIITMKHGVFALASLAGLGGGYTINEKFHTSAAPGCIVSSVESETGRTKYTNNCDRRVQAVICEDYGVKYGWFGGITQGAKSCLRTEFFTAQSQSFPKAGEKLTGVAIAECYGGASPHWIIGGYECVK